MRFLGVKWLFSFLSADKKKTYCLCEAPSAEAIRIAARRANVPAARIASWFVCTLMCRAKPR
jgi:hypothetical protein